MDILKTKQQETKQAVIAIFETTIRQVIKQIFTFLADGKKGKYLSISIF